MADAPIALDQLTFPPQGGSGRLNGGFQVNVTLPRT
jgi:hypothetical protein